MELFLAMGTAFIVEGLKWITSKLGQETTKWMVYLAVLIISGVWTYLKVTGILTEEFLALALKNVSIAIATYEIIIKWLLKENAIPEIGRIIKK